MFCRLQNLTRLSISVRMSRSRLNFHFSPTGWIPWFQSKYYDQLPSTDLEWSTGDFSDDRTFLWVRVSEPFTDNEKVKFLRTEKYNDSEPDYWGINSSAFYKNRSLGNNMKQKKNQNTPTINNTPRTILFPHSVKGLILYINVSTELPQVWTK